VRAELRRSQHLDDLDNGATGIVFPDVNSAADAQRAVNACKFAPIGRRRLHRGFAAGAIGEAVKLLNGRRWSS
jgi:2-keto-3-deoxy-L-rhamnonate aldolase RhmA